MKAYRTDLCFSPYLISKSCLTTLPYLSTSSTPIYCPMLELEEQRNNLQLSFDPGGKRRWIWNGMDSTICKQYLVYARLYMNPATAPSQHSTHQAYFLAETEYKLSCVLGNAFASKYATTYSDYFKFSFGMIHILLMYLTDNNAIMCRSLSCSLCNITPPRSLISQHTCVSVSLSGNPTCFLYWPDIFSSSHKHQALTTTLHQMEGFSWYQSLLLTSLVCSLSKYRNIILL